MINLDVDAEATRAAALRDKLKELIADEKVAKSLKGYKELRDRIYVLTRDSLAEIRCFAEYAFRKDKTEARRKLFVSAFRKRKRSRRKSNPSGTGAEVTA